jgi:hypothetical protein
MITIPSSVSAALNSSNYSTSLLVSLPGTNFKITDNHKDITYDSVTYSSSGELFLKTSNVSRTTDISANSYTVTVAGADQSAIQEYSVTNHVGKTATVYLAFLDDAHDLLASDSVLQLYTGIVDSWELSEGATTSEFSVKLTSHWASFEVVNGRFTNSASQQEYYPGDEFFKFSFQEELPIKWGS